MTVPHLNCGTLHPPSQLLVNGRGGLTAPATLVCRCLLVPAGKYWALIDAGLGMSDLRDPRGRLGDTFLRRVRPALDPEETAIRQVQKLDIDPHDVRSIILTHHDLDHVGGISDFPWADVYVSRKQVDLIIPALRRDMARRLHPAQWSHTPQWAPVDLLETWRSRPARRVSDQLRLVALDGHIDGHCAVVIDREGRSPLIHAGDAIMDARTDLFGGSAPLGLLAFQYKTRTDARAWKESRAWLKECVDDGMDVVCSHDPNPRITGSH